MLKKILLMMFVLIVLILIGGYFYVTNLDLNQHKTSISNKILGITGKEIAFKGPVNLVFLPEPVLRAENVVITNPDANVDDKPLMTIKSLEANLSIIPLLKGVFNVSLLTISEPTINVNKNLDGTYNWLEGVNDATMQTLKETNLHLNSLTVQNASFAYFNEVSEKKLLLKNLNAEIIAASLLGPFNIDGSYTRENQPGGFSISLGEVSNRFATSLNFAVSQPSSQSILRFDGSFLTENNSFNGDVVFSSAELKKFVDFNFEEFNLDKKYDYPLTFNFEIASTIDKTDLQNFIFEYGESKGAGNILFPHNKSNDKFFVPEIEMSFSLTQLNPEPVINLILETLNNRSINKNFGFNLTSNFNIVKTFYNNDFIENMSFNFDINEDKIFITDLKSKLPFNTTFNATAEAFSEEGIFKYVVEPSIRTKNFHDLLKWLKIDVYNENKKMYKTFEAIASVEGDAKQMKVSNIDATLDKSQIDATISVAFSKKPEMNINLNVRSINIDDYLSAQQPQANIIETFVARLEKATIFKNFDANINANVGVLIFDNKPFEGVRLITKIKDNQLNIENFEVQNLWGAELFASGEVMGFEKKLMLNNFKYKLIAGNFIDFTRKMAINIKNIEKIKNAELFGVLSGSKNNFNTKSVFNLDAYKLGFEGNVKIDDENVKKYNGRINVAASDFVDFVNFVGFNYKPNAYSLGTFDMSSEIDNNSGVVMFKNLKASVGNNKFAGQLNYTKGRKPKIITALKIDKFDTKRFLYNDINKSDTQKSFQIETAEEQNFLKKPKLSADKINFDFYKTFDLNANLFFNELEVHENYFHNAKVSLVIKENMINFANFEAELNQGKVKANAKIDINNTAQIEGKGFIKNQQLAPSLNSGIIYGLENATFNAENIVFNTEINSFESAINNLNAKFDLTLNNLAIKGFNINNIVTDVNNRTSPENFNEVLQKNLASGSSDFAPISCVVDIKNGEFNTQILSKSLENAINANIKGSINEWTINAEFALDFGINNVPSLDFGIVGPMNNPRLNINSSNLTEYFSGQQKAIKHHQQMLEEEKKNALENAIKKEFDVAISNNNKAHEISNKLTTLKIQPQVQAEYDSVKKSVDELLAEINIILLEKENAVYSQEVLNNVIKANETSTQKTANVNAEFEKFYIKVLKEDINADFKQISKIYEQANVEQTTYLQEIKNINKQIDQLMHKYNISADKKLFDINVEFNNYMKEILLVYTNAKTFIENNVKNDSIENLEKSFAKMQEYKKEIDFENNLLLQTKSDAIEHMNTIHKKISEQKEKEVVEKKIIENTGSISVEDKGTLMIKKDIEQIEKIEKQKLQVLDFSRPDNID